MKNAVGNLNKKPFRAFDVAIYGIIALLIVLLFVFIEPQTGKQAEVLVKGERVLLVDLDKKSCVAYSDAVLKTGENVYRIKTEKGFNDITIDFENRSVKVTDADCANKECKAMRLDGGAIICVPHSLIIKYCDEILSPKVG